MSVSAAINKAHQERAAFEKAIYSALEEFGLLPKNEGVQFAAVYELITAIENYNRHLDPAISLARNELKYLSDSLANASHLLQRISPQTLTIYSKASEYVNQYHANLNNINNNDINIGHEIQNNDESQGVTSIGEISIPLDQALKATKKATQVIERSLEIAKEKQNKVSNIPRNVFALNIALVMRDTIRKKPTFGRDSTAAKVGSRGGAAYARLLRRMLSIAGDIPPDDLNPLLKFAKDNIGNPRGDNKK
jgi:hypothetical protein